MAANVLLCVIELPASLFSLLRKCTTQNAHSRSGNDFWLIIILGSVGFQGSPENLTFDAVGARLVSGSRVSDEKAAMICFQ
jgi:hypothetical protein